MKLVLSTNQSKEFKKFFREIQQGQQFFDYSGYKDLLFIFDLGAVHPASFYNLATGRYSYEYRGAYLKGHEACPDTAFAVANVLDSNHVPFVDTELVNGPSFTKLSTHAKLATARINTPRTYGGCAEAIMRGFREHLIKSEFPVVLKRAGASRGVDNLRVSSMRQLQGILRERKMVPTVVGKYKYKRMVDEDIWLVQELIECDGFYRVNLSFGEPQYVIFRSLSDKPDRNPLYKHIYKPAGGVNAKLVDMRTLAPEILTFATQAALVARRQCAGVDVLCGRDGRIYVLEVNNDPQLVTVNTFPEVRRQAFLRLMRRI